MFWRKTISYSVCNKNVFMDYCAIVNGLAANCIRIWCSWHQVLKCSFFQIFSKTLVRTETSFRQKVFPRICATKKFIRPVLWKTTVWPEIRFKETGKLDDKVKINHCRFLMFLQKQLLVSKNDSNKNYWLLHGL